MATVLGIHTLSFDSGATLMRDGLVTAAVHEERLRRIKHVGGFPWLSIRKVLDVSDTSPNEIDIVAVGATHSESLIEISRKFSRNVTFLNPLKSKKDLYKIYFFEQSQRLRTSLSLTDKLDTSFSNFMLRQALKKTKIHGDIYRIDHHTCHAASAFYSSGFKRCLVITADARGDGISSTVSIADENGIHRLSSSPESASMGHFYGGVTEALGFRYACDEGKTEALAAFGGHSEVYEKLDAYVRVDKIALKGCIAPHQRLISVPFSGLLKNFRRENLAYAAQAILEKTFCELIENAVEATGITCIALAGGIFLNVKLNKRIMELPSVKNVFIHPAAGDQGIPTGAAFTIYHELFGLRSTRWNNVFLGNRWHNEEIKKILRRNGYKIEFIEDIGGYVGEELLPKGKIVGWFQDRMEYGPRALGARSILADPRTLESPRKIRASIKKRPSFQPFCPSMQKDAEKKYIFNPKEVDSSFMIIAFDAKQRMVNEAPAVVFVDNSTRIQTVKKDSNRQYYDTIKSFGKVTGIPILLNTSFNKSGEPIVCTPNQALYDLRTTGLDFVVIENFLVRKK